jgi:hypothetical protein
MAQVPHVNLKPAAKPADFGGSAANVPSKNADAAPGGDLFGVSKLKKAPKPADFDGSAANTGVKPVEHAAIPSVALKHAGAPPP